MISNNQNIPDDLKQRHNRVLNYYGNIQPDEEPPVFNYGKSQPETIVYPKKSLKSLNMITIKELQLTKVMKESYLCVRICMPSCKGPSLYIVVADINGDVIEASICNLRASMTFAEGQQYMPLNQWIAIKYPYYKTYNTGVRGLRIEDQQDVILLTDFSAMKLLNINQPILTVEQYKQLGNQYFKNKQYTLSYECYTLALQSNDQIINEACYNNRAQTLINLGYINEALQDIQSVLTINANNYKAIFRKGVCLLKLNKPEEAKKYFESTPNWKHDKDTVFKVVQCELMKRYADGKFDILKLLKDYVEGEELFENVYPFIGPIIRKQSNVGGLGLFATRDIAKGEILIIERPFYIVQLNWDQAQTYSTTDYQFHDMFQLNFTVEMKEKARQDKQVAERLFNLYDGTSKYGLELAEPDFEYSLPLACLSHERIDNIFKLNGHAFKKNKSKCFQDNIELASSKASQDQGLWYTLSQFNHNYLPNVMYYFIGQLQIVVSLKHIKKNEELLLQYVPFIDIHEYSMNLKDHQVPVEQAVIDEQNRWKNDSHFAQIKEIEKQCIKLKDIQKLLQLCHKINDSDLHQLKIQYPLNYIRFTYNLSLMLFKNDCLSEYFKFKLLNIEFQLDKYPQGSLHYELVMLVLVAVQANQFTKEITQAMFKVGILMFGQQFITDQSAQDLFLQYAMKHIHK